MFFSVCHTYAQLVYHDASKFPLLGKAIEATGARMKDSRILEEYLPCSVMEFKP